MTFAHGPHNPKSGAGTVQCPLVVDLPLSTRRFYFVQSRTPATSPHTCDVMDVNRCRKVWRVGSSKRGLLVAQS